MTEKREKRERLDLEAIRERLALTRGEQYWRSLEEIAETEGFQEFLHREFPQGASEWLDPFGRRTFLKLMGASLALAGLAGCSTSAAPTDKKIVPYVKPPEELVPGIPLYYATAMPLGGYATGLLAKSVEGRPIKVEGNPKHPASLGAADAFAQTSVLTLYDPDRSQAVNQGGLISSWGAFQDAMATALQNQSNSQGAGLRLLTETVTSPTLASQIKALLGTYPQAKWHQFEPTSRDAARAGAQLAFGEYLETVYHLDKADVVLTLDSDFLTTGPGSLRYAHDFADRRRIQGGSPTMNRLYAVENTPTNTGAMADHRLPLKASEVEGFARALAVALGVQGVSSGQAAPSYAKWLAALVRDLQAHRGTSLIVAGDGQPAVVHALAHTMNSALGNVGSTLTYTNPVEARPVDQMASLQELVQDMNAGKVQVLVILGGNPVFTAPADLKFAEALGKVGLRAHLSLYDDETSQLCHWHVPETHYLESWGDVRAYDGTATIIQPLIAPLYGGHSALELVGILNGQSGTSDHDLVQQYWQSHHPGKDFDLFWRTALEQGIVAGTALPPKKVMLKTGIGVQPQAAQGPAQAGSLEVIFRPDPTIWDGRFANNGWLQELPKPLTRLTWDNAALLSPATAQRLGLSYDIGITAGEHGRIYVDVLELTYRGRTVHAPAWILPGHPDDAVTVYFGYGRMRAGRVGTGTGFNVYPLRPSDTPWFGAGLKIRKSGAQHLMASTQFHFNIGGRHLFRDGTLAAYQQHPEFVKEMGEAPAKNFTIYPGFPYEGYAWGMTIDLNACTGCSACVVACQAENNGPVVGKEQVSRAREMHWLRIDRYYHGDLANPQVNQQPVLCQQCENAPCELVCPVQATNHSSEGLNDMTYNRCVGTRYCSNNCPYKVRRFNFFRYGDFDTPSLKLLHNPDVTVRSRGVMEKCTYCVQRINHAKIKAEEENRQVRDGEILTACQQTCPTQAIVFGNINDPGSRVTQLKAEPRNYGMLAELNTRPRTTYLAKLRNPNPEIEKG